MKNIFNKNRILYFFVLIYMAFVGLYGYYVMTPPPIVYAQCRNIELRTCVGTGCTPAGCLAGQARRMGHNYNSNTQVRGCIRVW